MTQYFEIRNGEQKTIHVRLLVRLAERSKAPDLRHVPKVCEVLWSTTVGVGSNPTPDIGNKSTIPSFRGQLTCLFGRGEKRYDGSCK